MKRLVIWMAALFTLLGAVLYFGAPGFAAAKAPATGSISPVFDGNTVTLTATWSGVPKKDRVRLAVICQTENTSVVYGEAYDLTSSPETKVFNPTAGTYCRGDLYVIVPGKEITYLDTVKFERQVV